jgi:RimJ/RimL family protein N-acetyltransferase
VALPTLVTARLVLRPFRPGDIPEPWQKSPTFAVVFEGTLIGTVSFEVDAATRTAMIGYAIGRAHWGRGLASEAARAALAWAIGQLDLRRVWAATQVEHVRSQRGALVDEVVYGLDVTGDS